MKEMTIKAILIDEEIENQCQGCDGNLFGNCNYFRTLLMKNDLPDCKDGFIYKAQSKVLESMKNKYYLTVGGFKVIREMRRKLNE